MVPPDWARLVGSVDALWCCCCHCVVVWHITATLNESLQNRKVLLAPTLVVLFVLDVLTERHSTLLWQRTTLPRTSDHQRRHHARPTRHSVRASPFPLTLPTLRCKVASSPFASRVTGHVDQSPGKVGRTRVVRVRAREDSGYKPI